MFNFLKQFPKKPLWLIFDKNRFLLGTGDSEIIDNDRLFINNFSPSISEDGKFQMAGSENLSNLKAECLVQISRACSGVPLSGIRIYVDPENPLIDNILGRYARENSRLVEENRELKRQIGLKKIELNEAQSGSKKAILETAQTLGEATKKARGYGDARHMTPPISDLMPYELRFPSRYSYRRPEELE